MPFGVALSGPPSEFTATVNFLCSSTVHLNLAGFVDAPTFPVEAPETHDAFARSYQFA